jgi:hypothetical protein
MRKRNLMMPLAGLAITAGALLSAGITAGPASAATGTGCPATKAGVPIASNVSASVSTTGTTSSYTFTSLPPSEGPAGGVPGLVNYCVYPTSPTADPTGHFVTAKGDNGAKWVYATGGSNNFAFSRPGGNPSNIGLDGTSTPMGTATWASLNAVPDKQTIVLHINDPGMCASLYGAGTSATCFVRPTPPPPPGPDCTQGDHGGTVAYNSMPFDVKDCVNPAIGFEAQSASEFGNDVNLQAGTGRNLDSLKVDFQSFACQTGHWDGVPGDSTTPEPCAVTDPSHLSYQWPITANIYSADSSGNPVALLATDTETQTIPYRPTADTTNHCTGPSGAPDAANRWWNPAAIGGGHCQSSIATVLSFSNFTAPGGGSVASLPENVIWTVAFNTTDYGVNPAGTPCLAGSYPGLADGGCPYDSLNVGDNGNTGADNLTSHIDNAPYAGTDVTLGAAELNSSWTGAYHDGGPAGSLRLDMSGWNGLRPLGSIIAH